MIPDDVVAALRERAGLTVDSLGEAAVESALVRGARARSLSTERWAERVALGGSDFEDLLEEVLVLESWFFRDRAPFDELASRARALGRPVRALSMPCASGEEPYSMVIAMAQAGVPLDQISVDAWDLSERGLTAARRGVYGSFAFRGAPDDLVAAWFERSDAGMTVAPAVRGRVRFARANALDLPERGHHDTFDFAFCRNLLIYLDRPARAQVLRSLQAMLRTEGVLFLGNADGFPDGASGLVAAGPPGAFAFRQRPEAAARGRSQDRLPAVVAPRRPPPPVPSRPRAESPAAPAVAPRELTLLEQASALADRGVMQEALTLCRAHTERTPLDVGGHRLLGVVLAALGDLKGADAALRRALYLDGRDDGALLHAGLVAERLGDVERARSLRRRRTGGDP